MSPRLVDILFYGIGGLWVLMVAFCVVMTWQEARAGVKAARARAVRRREDFRMQQYARKQGL